MLYLDSCFMHLCVGDKPLFSLQKFTKWYIYNTIAFLDNFWTAEFVVELYKEIS
jgi:hypothetical protein